MNRKQTLTTRTRNFSARAIFAALLALPAFATQADGLVEGYVMKAVEDRAHGSLILHGRYESALRRNRNWARLIADGADEDRAFPFAVSTNLCVAHTLVGRYDEAQAFCDAAVRAAALDAKYGRRDSDYAAAWATALSNRGVLKVLIGDQHAARADFVAAVGTARSSHAAANLAWLEGQRPELAGVTHNENSRRSAETSAPARPESSRDAKSGPDHVESFEDSSGVVQ